MNEEFTPTKTGTVVAPATEKSTNIYPFVRRMFFVLCIILALLLILFLVYQNGKSIYDNGI